MYGCLLSPLAIFQLLFGNSYSELTDNSHDFGQGYGHLLNTWGQYRVSVYGQKSTDISIQPSYILIKEPGMIFMFINSRIFLMEVFW